MSVQYGFYYNQERCAGCKACVVACKDWNGVRPGPANWRRVTTVEQGTFPSTKVMNLSLGCNHCENPACVAVCPVQAISKREDGIVLVDRNKCIECHQCEENCPFGVPQFGDDRSEPKKDPKWESEHPMQKCTLCYDRLAEDKAPACVGSCPQRALDFGTMDYLKSKYPNSTESVIGFANPARTPEGDKLEKPTNPSIRFRKK